MTPVVDPQTNSLTLPLSMVGFNGERIDPVPGSYHLGSGYRMYNPTLKRFTAPDDMSPFGKGGTNPYAYREGDPINHTDPTGHHIDPFIRGIMKFTEDGVWDGLLLATDGAVAPEDMALREGEYAARADEHLDRYGVRHARRRGADDALAPHVAAHEAPAPVNPEQERRHVSADESMRRLRGEINNHPAIHTAISCSQTANDSRGE